ncbi:MAG: hypothetical protein VW935_06105, partial [Novosphingobium sp.]
MVVAIVNSSFLGACVEAALFCFTLGEAVKGRFMAGFTAAVGTATAGLRAGADWARRTFFASFSTRFADFAITTAGFA